MVKSRVLEPDYGEIKNKSTQYILLKKNSAESGRRDYKVEEG